MFGFWIRSVMIICWLIPSECWGARFKIYFYPYSSLETRDHPDTDPGPSLSLFSWSDVTRLKCIALEWRWGVFLQWREHRAELRAVQQIENHQVCPVRPQINDGDGDNDVENSSWSENNQSRFQAQRLQLVSGAPKPLFCSHGVTRITPVCCLFCLCPKNFLAATDCGRRRECDAPGKVLRQYTPEWGSSV